MGLNPEDFPAITYQNVTDVGGVLAHLPAVPTISLSLEEFEAFLEAGAAIVEQGRAERALASEFGYPMTAEVRRAYPGTGVHVLISGPGEAQLLVSSARRMTGRDAQPFVEGIFSDEGGLYDSLEPDGEHYPQYGEQTQSLGAEVEAEVIQLYTNEPGFVAADPITIDGVTKERAEWEAQGWQFTTLEGEDFED